MVASRGYPMNKRNPNNRQREVISTFKEVMDSTSGIENAMSIVENFLEKQNNNKREVKRK